MTKQEIFNKVKTHLLTQKVSCVENDVCKYRYNGLSCAVGCLFDDDTYDPNMEGASIYDVLSGHLTESTFALRKALHSVGIKESSYYLLIELQKIHDLRNEENWAYYLRETASDFRLKY